MSSQAMTLGPFAARLVTVPPDPPAPGKLGQPVTIHTRTNIRTKRKRDFGGVKCGKSVSE